jgi:hypothetical protein
VTDNQPAMAGVLEVGERARPKCRGRHEPELCREGGLHQLMSGYGARCEHAGGALCEPRGLSPPGGPTAAPPRPPAPRMRRPIPAY